MENIGLSLACYTVAYIIVTLIGMLHTLYNIYVRHMEPINDKSMGEAYEKTKPYHPLYNLCIFPVAAYFYLQHISHATACTALYTGLLWFAISIIIDYLGWVLIKHPWSLTFKEFYVDYQPWISLIYLIILIAPLVAWLVL